MIRFGFWWVAIGPWAFNSHCPYCGRRGVISTRFPYPCRRSACRTEAVDDHREYEAGLS